MTEIDVTTSLQKIEFDPDTYTEILQNIRMILTTAQGSCPLHRDFGLSTELIDDSIAVVKAKMAGEIAAQITKYESRVEIVSITYDDEPAKAYSGKLYPRVRVRIIE